MDERAALNGSGSTVLAWAAASDSNTTSVNPATKSSGAVGKKVRADHQSVLTVSGHGTRQPGTQGQQCMSSAFLLSHTEDFIVYLMLHRPLICFW